MKAVTDVGLAQLWAATNSTQLHLIVSGIFGKWYLLKS